jgi:microcin C transport system permease protein
VFQYILKRLLLMIPTLLGITLIVFMIVNLAPGSPIEQKLQALRFGGAMGNSASSGAASSVTSKGDTGVSNEVVEALKKQYGFDKPVHVRYGLWLKNLVSLDFGQSFTYEEPVIDVISSKFPVSLQFGITSLILAYLVSIPLGIRMALKDGQPFDIVASTILFITYSIPSFALAILLIVFLAGGSFLDLFPIGGIASDNAENLPFFDQVLDRIHHFILPLICYSIGSFTTLTLLMKNSILEEIRKDYVRTARAKGLDERKVYLKHALRNALIPVATGLGSFVTVFFSGALLIETIFQLDGIGLLGYKSVLSRDYNLIMGSITIQSFLFLIGNLISDLIYVGVDPRIDFSESSSKSG